MLAVFSAAIWALVNAARSSVCVIKTATCAVDSAARSPASIALTWADERPAIWSVSRAATWSLVRALIWAVVRARI